MPQFTKTYVSDQTAICYLVEVGVIEKNPKPIPGLNVFTYIYSNVACDHSWDIKKW